MDYARVGSGVAIPAPANKPVVSEIGIIQRVEGLRVGLDDLRNRLAQFDDRLNGSASATTESGNTVGIYGNLDEAESCLRACLNTISHIHSKF